MSPRNYTTYLLKELDFLKLLITRFHDQDKAAGLELDIALLKTQEIYEQLLRMKLAPAAGTSEKHTTPHVSVAEAPPVAEDKVHTASQPEPTKKAKQPEPIAPPPPPPPVEIVPEPPTHEVEVFATEQPIVLPKEELTAEHEEKKQSAKPAAESQKHGSGILAEKISPADFHPINETLAQKKTGTDLSSRMQTAPLSSIAAGIGLNDKFLYIRELFKGDNALYSNTLRHLDTASSLGDAMDFIHRHFSWDKDNDTAQKFLHLVHRRHVQ